MASTAADVLIESLQDWNVEFIFGLPGDGINGIMESLRRRQDKVRFIQVRHEEAAAFMACGYAKYTGKLGVCLATSGPGGIHLLNGLYDAKLDGQPVLAITGHHYHDLIDTHAQQDVNLDRLFADVAVRLSVIEAWRTLISRWICKTRKSVSVQSAMLLIILLTLLRIGHGSRLKMTLLEPRQF